MKDITKEKTIIKMNITSITHMLYEQFNTTIDDQQLIGKIIHDPSMKLKRYFLINSL